MVRQPVGRDELRRHVAEEWLAKAKTIGESIQIECCEQLVMIVRPHDTDIDAILDRASKTLSEEWDPRYVLVLKPADELLLLSQNRIQFEKTLAEQAMAPMRKRLQLPHLQQPCAA